MRIALTIKQTILTSAGGANQNFQQYSQRILKILAFITKKYQLYIWLGIRQTPGYAYLRFSINASFSEYVQDQIVSDLSFKLDKFAVTNSSRIGTGPRSSIYRPLVLVKKKHCNLEKGTYRWRPTFFCFTWKWQKL